MKVNLQVQRSADAARAVVAAAGQAAAWPERRRAHTTASAAMGWEAAAASKAGVALSLLRFALAFLASVLVGILYPLVPTVKGACRQSGCPAHPPHSTLVTDSCK